MAAAAAAGGLLIGDDHQAFTGGWSLVARCWWLVARCWRLVARRRQLGARRSLCRFIVGRADRVEVHEWRRETAEARTRALDRRDQIRGRIDVAAQAIAPA